MAKNVLETDLYMEVKINARDVHEIHINSEYIES